MTHLEQIEKQTQCPITSESHKTRESSFGSKRDVPESMLKEVPKNYLQKHDGRKRKKCKFVDIKDAKEAGGPNSDKCTLILAVGRFAEALAGVGLSVVGKDHYGVLPLRGKLPNVREASTKQIMYNEEIQNIKKFLGLQQEKEYTDTKSLRYGHLMIMTDQNPEGSYIKGLLINFIHWFWPSLLKVPTFMVDFTTPILKAYHSDGIKLYFYTMHECDLWRKELGNNANDWTIFDCECLAATSLEEGEEYFGDLDKHKRYFFWDEHSGREIEKVFSKEKAHQRKLWIHNFEPGSFRYHRAKYLTYISYSDFINEELIWFFWVDLERSIPSMVDGLKPLQRKILFYSFKKLFEEIPLDWLICYVLSHCDYYYKYKTIASTVINMAQDFVGTNNINLLKPNGNFGSRKMGGKDHATTELIYTKLSTITRCIFPENDDKFLEYMNENGQSIEPKWYMPVIPLVLVNGSKGIGTYGSFFIPNYNPREIIANIRRMLNGETMVPMKPWYKGFKGVLLRNHKEGDYVVNGLVEEIDEQTFRIKELPIGQWTQDYVKFLKCITDGLLRPVKDPLIDAYIDKSNKVVVDIKVRMKPDKIEGIMKKGLLKKFKLSTHLSTNNMHLFEAGGRIKKYDNPQEILEEFFPLRLEVYERRRVYIEKNLKRLLQELDNKINYILGVLGGEIMIFKNNADTVIDMQKKGFTPNEEEDTITTGYDYLLHMLPTTFNLKSVEKFEAERAEKQRELQILKTTTSESMWLKDLDELEKKLDDIDREEAEMILRRQQIF